LNPKIERVEIFGSAMALVGECLKAHRIALRLKFGVDVTLDD
jgi:hypothetical protein